MSRLIEDDELIRLYAEPGRGYTDQEMGDRFGIGRDAIFKRRKKFKEDYGDDFFVETERGRYRIDSQTFVSNIKVSWEEALILYLATRRLSRSTRLPKQPVQNALSKLSTALYKPMTERLVRAASDVVKHPEEEKRQEILTTLIRGWSEQLKVHIHYLALNNTTPKKHTICPYLIEPSPWSDSVYVIAKTNATDVITPFQLERIVKAALGTEPFEVDSKFKEETLFKYTWGIWYSDKQPETICLRFTGKEAVRRVQESVWHPDQETELQDDGSLIWEAPIAEPQEMLPWIRGWGAHVDVERPDELREKVKAGVWEQAQVYALATRATDIDSRLLRLWGKTTDDPNHFHPALYHMFDVAHVAQQLLSSRASNRWKQVLADALNTDAAALTEWLPYLIALHDVGKLSVPFQVLNLEQHTRLKHEGFTFGKTNKNDGRDLHHTIVGRIVLKEWVIDWPGNLKAAFMEMVSGHHGVFQSDVRKDRSNFNRLKEAGEWLQLRRRAIQILQSYLLQQWPDPLPNPTNQSAAMMALNGFCILCDWLGSDEDYFTPAPHTTLIEYIPQSRNRAYNRVRNAGFFQTAYSKAPTQFVALFPDIPQARPLQAAIDEISDDLLQHPTLTIIEAPTGEGKTEAALALARRIAALRGTDEMYIALPTTATSNAMFERVQTHLQQRLHLPPELVKLVHGQDFLVEDDLRINAMHSIEPDGQTESPSLAWFAPKKKALLAPIGVGTIDQAELSALNVRHNALRMIGLAGKIIILDEVHAYDTYMTTIIKRMLTWLSALGSSVILLSATLPSARRKELAQAFAGNQADAIIDYEAYPSLFTIGLAGYHLDTPQAYQPNKTLTLHLQSFTADDPAAKAQWLIKQVQQGGCACWMVNTVKRAQQIYNELLKTAPPDISLDLLHARFPLLIREARESAIMKKYGKKGSRPAKGIVVGTQVLEQSLDLDFDVMMTDLAPIDLILQRAGRLHRHEREAAGRYHHQTPHLYVNTIVETADRRIYTDYILQKTRQILNGRDALTLPDDYRPLIEDVYTETPPTPDDSLYDAWNTLKDKRNNLEREAKQRLTNTPDPAYPFYHSGKFQGFKEEEDSSGWMVAQTRWGQESITVIPLVREDETARTVSGEVMAALNQKTDRDTQLKLLRYSLRVSHYNLVEHFKTPDETFKLFTDSPLLRNYVPLWLEPGEEDGLWINQELDLQLHPKLGLVIGEL